LKTELTSFDVAAIVFELNHRIKDARIGKIYQINPTTLLLKLHRRDESPLHLLIESGKRMHLTSYVFQKPLKPPAFCMAIRKSLQNGKITGVQQHEFERTVSLNIQTAKGEFQLITELFGEGNIILVGPENKILQALTYKRMRDRNVLRGENFQYAPPSGKNPLKISRKDFEEIKGLGKLEIVKALTRFLSIGGMYAEEILLRAEIDKNTPCEALGKRELDKIFAQLQSVLSLSTNGKINPHLVVDKNGSWIDVIPFPLRKYKDFQTKAYKTFNEALDEFYMKTQLKAEIVQAAREFERQLAKLQRILKKQKEALEDSKREVERNKKLGDLIYAHLGELQLLRQRIVNEKQGGKTWQQIVSAIKKEKESGLVPSRYFEALDNKHRILTVSLEDTTLQLDLTRSVQANAARYYGKAKKSQRKMEGAEKALLETQTKIKELQQKKQEIMKAKKPPSVRREKAWNEKFRWFYTSESLLVIRRKRRHNQRGSR